MATFTIFSAGAAGTALAIHLAKNNHKVYLYCHIPEDVEILKTQRENVRFLPGFKLPENISIVTDCSTVKESDCVITAIPAVAGKELSERIKPNLSPDTLILSTCKGVVEGKRMSDWFEAKNFHVFMGPAFAKEIAAGKLTRVVIAGKQARKLKKWLTSPAFTVTPSPDVKGAELGGIIKNAYAIAAGICDGLEIGPNAKAVVVSSALNEMLAVGKKFGAKQKTLLGLAGLGDLLASSYGPSRNRQLGELIAKGETLEQATKQLGTVEGLGVVKFFAHEEFPMLAQLNKILFHAQPPSILLELFWQKG